MRLVVLAIVSAMLAGCSETPNDGAIAVHAVYDSCSMPHNDCVTHGLESVAVSIQGTGLAKATDANGWANFTGLPRGTLVVQANYMTGQAKQSTVLIGKDWADPTASVSFLFDV